MKYLSSLILCAALVLSATGCAYDAFVVKSIETLRDDHIKMMDERDEKAVKAGDPKLDDDFRKNEIGAYDDLIDYLKADSE